MRRRRPGRFRYAKPGPFDQPFKPRGPLLRGRALHPRLRRELRRANQLMAIGEHVNAAQMFISLAEQARDSGIVYPAPMLFLQAAHAYLLAESFELSLAQARTGLDLLAAQERWQALKRESLRYIQALESAGRQADEQQLRAWLDEEMQGKTFDEKPSAQLPEKCPYCGASMSLEQINAGGGHAAECQYCGSVVLPRSEE
jgi:DNA-directed RNA polymerase subunit RPC12/RpoP